MKHIGAISGGKDRTAMARLPAEPYCDDPDCTCTTARRDKWCPIHGKDPDEEYEKQRERQWDRDA